MSRKLTTAERRAAAAYGVLLGRPPRPHYGILIVVPLIAAACGALIGIRLDQIMVHRADARLDARPEPAPADPAPASAPN